MSEALAAAIATAKEYLIAGDPPAIAIADAAAEHGLLPALVERRFALHAGKTPAEWLAQYRAAQPAVAAASAANAAADAAAAARAYEANALIAAALVAWATDPALFARIAAKCRRTPPAKCPGRHSWSHSQGHNLGA